MSWTKKQRVRSRDKVKISDSSFGAQVSSSKISDGEIMWMRNWFSKKQNERMRGGGRRTERKKEVRNLSRVWGRWELRERSGWMEAPKRKESEEEER